MEAARVSFVKRSCCKYEGFWALLAGHAPHKRYGEDAAVAPRGYRLLLFACGESDEWRVDDFVGGDAVNVVEPVH